MNPAADIRDHTLDGLVHNQDQERLIANATAEIDSLAEIFALLHRTSMPEQRRYIADGVQIVNRLLQSNRAEGDCGRHVASVAEELASHVARGSSPMGKRAFARAVRDPLADLTNPIITGPRYQRAVDLVVIACRKSTRANILSATVSHEIGPKRYAILEQLVDGMIQRGVEL